MTVYECISSALASNPDLVALRDTEQVGVATVGVAETYPFNPFIQAQVTPGQYLPGGGPSGSTYHYVLLMQRIQLAHQQQYREDAAHSALNGVRWNIHQAELQATAMTAQLYFTVLYQRGLLEVARRSQLPDGIAESAKSDGAAFPFFRGICRGPEDHALVIAERRRSAACSAGTGAARYKDSGRRSCLDCQLGCFAT